MTSIETEKPVWAEHTQYLKVSSWTGLFDILKQLFKRHKDENNDDDDNPTYTKLADTLSVTVNLRWNENSPKAYFLAPQGHTVPYDNYEFTQNEEVVVKGLYGIKNKSYIVTGNTTSRIIKYPFDDFNSPARRPSLMRVLFSTGDFISRVVIRSKSRVYDFSTHVNSPAKMDISRVLNAHISPVIMREDSLTNICMLYEKGLLSDDEFKKAKSMLLN